jgi:hypothetical protein
VVRDAAEQWTVNTGQNHGIAKVLCLYFGRINGGIDGSTRLHVGDQALLRIKASAGVRIDQIVRKHGIQRSNVLGSHGPHALLVQIDDHFSVVCHFPISFHSTAQSLEPPRAVLSVLGVEPHTAAVLVQLDAPAVEFCFVQPVGTGGRRGAQHGRGGIDEGEHGVGGYHVRRASQWAHPAGPNPHAQF